MKRAANVLLNSIAALGLLAGLSVCALAAPAAASDEGIALAIVFDTSGSMNDPVADSKGTPTPKYQIANRALKAIVDRLEAYQTGGTNGAPHAVEAALVTFRGIHPTVSVEYGPFRAAKFRSWAEGFSKPSGATPLGEAVEKAGNLVLGSKLRHRHVLVVTDGQNTAGAEPWLTIPRLRQQALEHEAVVGVHFVAFDVDARLFDPVKKLGATVVSAADEKQLNAQLQYILQRKILLEDEEPPTHSTAAKP